MPWSVGDVDKHKKGLTGGQKKKWVEVANGVLAECKRQGGSDCEGKAIRIANSKFEDDLVPEFVFENVKAPVHAFNLTGTDCLAKVVPISNDENSPVQLDITCYSGSVIKNHWYWGDLAIDLSGMSFPKSKYPILEGHDVDRKIAFSGKPIIDDEGKLKLDPSGVQFLDTEPAREFIRLSRQGFPFEASIRAYPTRYQRLGEGEESEVNGFTMKGPGTIWRKSTFKEVSVCVFGWDDKTQAKVLSLGNTDEVEFGIEVEQLVQRTENHADSAEGGKTAMDLKELKEKHPELVEQLRREGAVEFTTTFSDEKAQLTAKITDLEKTNTVLEQKVVILDEKVKEQEYNSFMLSVNKSAEVIWKDALMKSKIPAVMFTKEGEYLQDNKVTKHVEAKSFVKDGAFDQNAFSEAVKAEVTDWESRFSGFSHGNTQVLGLGSTSQGVVPNQPNGSPGQLSQEDKDWIKKVAALSDFGTAKQTT